MNIYKFLNSKDIRKYLEEKNHQFTLPESAYVIARSYLPIKKRQSALLELIEETEDISLPARNDTDEIKSFHQYLKDYVDYQNYLIEIFKETDSNCIYRYRLQTKKGYQIDSCYVFTTFDECIKMAHEEFDAERDRYFSIKKKEFGVDDKEKEVRSRFLDANFNADCEIFKTDFFNPISALKNSCKNFSFFYNFWFSIPLPFKKGDIICKTYDKTPMIFDHTIVDKFTSETENDYQKRINQLCKNGNCNDMEYFAYSYSTYSNDIQDMISIDSFCNYLELEYYDGELSGKEKGLIPFSNYLKGEIDVELLVNSSITLKLDELRNQYRKFFSLYTNEGLHLAGLDYLIK